MKIKTKFCIAQLNLGYLKYGRFSKRMSSYLENLEKVIQMALNDPGFIWIHQDDTIETVNKLWGRNAAANLSTWIDVEYLRKFMFTKLHLQAMGRREDWFVPQKKETFVLWYVPEGNKPTFYEAHERLEFFRMNGQTEYAFNDLFSYPKAPQY